jgi:hypothetical protein
MERTAKIALLIGSSIAFFTAIAHASCIFLGPACFKAQMAPPELVESAKQGTWLAPIATLVISGMFILCGLYALSGAKFIKKIPLTHLALVVISGLCIIRGLGTIPLSFIFPEMVSAFSILADVIWLVVGLLYAYGFKHYHKNNS